MLKQAGFEAVEALVMRAPVHLLGKRADVRRLVGV